ncbi:MAG: hypothetical protein ACYSW7_09340 [Planctomycetota bacterium]|jgi:hypothetical protein
MRSSSENIGEKETKIQNKKQNTSKLAIISMVLGVFSVSVLAVIAIIFPWDIETVAPYVLYAGLAVVLSLATGMAALVVTTKHSSKVIGRWLATLGIIAAIASIILGWLVVSRYIKQERNRILCVENLTRNLGFALGFYRSENNEKYPPADKWCDLLLPSEYATDKDFICPSAKKGFCHYAMNPYCEPNSPRDTVLLFESKPGWNQFGGPELLAPENHRGKGCHILFNGQYVWFIRTEKFCDLKWKGDPNESENQEGKGSKSDG